ncbi:MAG: hypothetical protein ACYCO9_00945 [Streptosporangiaceae bacterium]
MVVADDRIEPITAAIAEGRAMWASVRDAIAMLLDGNLGEVAFTVGGGLLLPAGSPLDSQSAGDSPPYAPRITRDHGEET